VPMIRHHHEHYDGSGYPDGLKGESIPIGARILTACDALETMIAGRPGIPRRPAEEAVAELLRGAGTRFDPGVVRALCGMLQTGGIGPDSTHPYAPLPDSTGRFPLGF